ncbi:MAG: hypothetical protein JWM11_135 [Planctomycetaceae bacterium]|nr:hypothetical protein [Planctomycetaceae bacterium]
MVFRDPRVAEIGLDRTLVRKLVSSQKSSLWTPHVAGSQPSLLFVESAFRSRRVFGVEHNVKWNWRL